MSFAAAIERMTFVIERLAGHKAMRYINYVLVGALVLATLLAAREAINLVFSGNNTKAGSEAGIQGKEGRKGGKRGGGIDQYGPAVKNNIFDIKGQELEILTASDSNRDIPSEPVSATPAAKLHLLGTVAWSDNTGYAFIAKDGSEQDMYKSGQEIEGAGTLKEIYPDRVVMAWADSTYEVKMDELGNNPPAPAPRVAGFGGRPGRGSMDQRSASSAAGGKDFSRFARKTGNREYVVSKRAIDESLQNPSNIMTDAHLIPNMVNGAQQGFKVAKIKRGGIYDTLGLMANDVLLSVNNLELSSMDSAMQAFTTMQGASNIEIKLSRNGKNITLKYNIR